MVSKPQSLPAITRCGSPTAAETFFKDRAEMMRRLEVLNHTLAHNTKYIVPSNASLVNVLGLDGVTATSVNPAEAPVTPKPGTASRSI